ncbi:MAG: class II aldolase/adducin family protein [Planctomycetota bacterium]|jgi:L-fuculose-phosphate aldolase
MSRTPTDQPATPDEADLRKQICEIGRRMWMRGYCAANEGNISYRLDDNRILCTPTMISKGYMREDDLCVINMDLEQVSGARKVTSEIRLHVQLYKDNDRTRAVVHCHPPHATAFGVVREDVPTGILPEPELFLGVVPRVPYETPGTWDFARTVSPHAHTASAVILENHGSVTWHHESLEHAFWNTEILESYCRLVTIARQLGNTERLTRQQVETLLSLRPQFGLAPDPRANGPSSDEDLFINRAFGCLEGGHQLPDDAIDTIVDRVSERLIEALKETRG